MVDQDESWTTRLYNEDWTGPGLKSSRPKVPCGAVVGQRLWIGAGGQPSQNNSRIIFFRPFVPLHFFILSQFFFPPPHYFFPPHTFFYFPHFFFLPTLFFPPHTFFFPPHTFFSPHTFFFPPHTFLSLPTFFFPSLSPSLPSPFFLSFLLCLLFLSSFPPSSHWAPFAPFPLPLPPYTSPSPPPPFTFLLTLQCSGTDQSIVIWSSILYCLCKVTGTTGDQIHGTLLSHRVHRGLVHCGPSDNI